MLEFKKNKVIFLRHSPILFIPIIGTLVYKLQIFLYMYGLTNKLWISRKVNKQRNNLLKIVSGRYSYVVCQSYKFGRHLSPIKCILVSDFIAPKNFKIMPLSRLHDISWTFILSEFITVRTKKSFGNFLPKKFKLLNLDLLLK